MNNHMNELDMLNIVAGGQKLGEMSAFAFLQFVANKLNGVKSFAVEAVELTSLIRVPPMSKNMFPEKKIEILNKLLKLGITLP